MLARRLALLAVAFAFAAAATVWGQTPTSDAAGAPPATWRSAADNPSVSGTSAEAVGAPSQATASDPAAPNGRTFRVFHTPQMQEVVADVVDRFVSSEAQTHGFGLRVVTLSHPNWRARAQRPLQRVRVQAPGVRAWLLEKEDAAILLAELQRRSDYREHSSPHLLVNNGQSSVVSAPRGRSYVREAVLRTDSGVGLQ